jgi:hypothetical protein
MEDELYDEFGNYIGPELDNIDQEEDYVSDEHNLSDIEIESENKIELKVFYSLINRRVRIK